MNFQKPNFKKKNINYRTLENKNTDIKIHNSKTEGEKEMKKGKDKDMLIKEIITNIGSITSDRNSIIEMKEHLANKHGISHGRVENTLNNPNIMKDADMRELLLIAEQFFLKTGIANLNPKEWFTVGEIKEARQFHQSLYNVESASLPITLEDVNIASNNVYSTTIDAKKIAEWMKSGILKYNYDIQRQHKRTLRKNGVIEKAPTVYRKNVREIKNLMVKGQLVVTTIALNAAVGTSDSGEELYYDNKSKTLTINEGTSLDILDGFHRSLASVEAYDINPDLNFKFILIVSNFTTMEAQQYQAQLAKATPIPKSRTQELEANRHADAVVQQLRVNSELKDRVPSGHSISYTKGDLVSYHTLSNAIDREFNITARIEVKEVADYLGEFFDYLIGKNQEEFSADADTKKSLMSYNKMFAGYVALAAKMKKENIEPSKVNDIIESIDFSKENPLWQEIGVLNSDLIISKTLKDRDIANYFKNLKIN